MNKVLIMRGKKTAMFLLTDNELQHLRKSSQYTARHKKEAMNACCGRCYNTALFVTFDLFMGGKKNNQFRRIFDLVGENTDFEWRIDNQIKQEKGVKSYEFNA